MRTSHFSSLAVRIGATFFSIGTFAAISHAATVSVDGNNYNSLSAAVAFVQAQDDGPHVINIMVDSLNPTAGDTQIVISEPITINGDADGNTTACDILVSMSDIRGSAIPDEGAPGKCYIEIGTAGNVNINDLRIHPSVDGAGNGGGLQRVDGIRMYKPQNADEVGNYTLTNVYVSGSDSSLAYLRLDDDADLYHLSGRRRWGHGGSNNETNAVIQLMDTDGTEDEGAEGDPPEMHDGIYNVVLDHCQAGLGKSSALNIMRTGGTVLVDGGLYGHCARDGIRIAGTGVTIKGTPEDRLRIIRAVNETQTNSHGIEIDEAGTQVDLIEWVDVSVCASGNAFKMGNASTLTTLRHCRFMEKSATDDPLINQAFYMQGPAVITNPVTACTIVGSGGNPDPIATNGNISGTFSFRDCIIASTELGDVFAANNDPELDGETDGLLGFDHCALPTDQVAGESLNTDWMTGNGEAFVPVPDPATTVIASPLFSLTLADYDWSDAQNGNGNADVYRPSNKADYTAAGSDGSNLVGGAGGTALPVSLSGFSIE